MNLVQINEHLKDVPIQKLMEYANGKDPMVPAYMATGEMQRRESMQQRVAASQQAAQGQQPTVKDQIQQKAGLMALQAQQQQQAQQQMMQQAQAQPMPVPPQTPQPSMQEEEQPEYAMGGIAQLPVDYDFASGGIIAFGKGDMVEDPDAPAPTLYRDVYETFDPTLEGRVDSKKGRLRPFRSALFDTLRDSQFDQRSKDRAKQEFDKQNKSQDIGLPSLAKDTRPGANIPGLYDDTAQKVAQERLKPRSVQDIAATQAEADKLAGVTGKYGEEQMKRYGEEDAQYKEMIKDRAFNNLLSVLSGMGRGGLGGAAPAYLQAQAAQQAADIAQKRRMTEKYGDVEAKQREEALAKSKGITTPYEAGYTQAGDIASRQATQQMASQTEFEKEAINNKNQLDRQELQYKKDIQLAKDRQASELQLQKIREDHDFKVEELRRKNANALEQFRQNAPPEEQKNLNAYLARWKKNPANKDKPETDGVTQYFSDRLGGQFTENKTDVTGLNQLLTSYQKQLEDITLPEAEKTRIRAEVIRTQKDLEAAIGRGTQGGLSSLTNNKVVDFGSLK